MGYTLTGSTKDGVVHIDIDFEGEYTLYKTSWGKWVEANENRCGTGYQSYDVDTSTSLRNFGIGVTASTIDGLAKDLRQYRNPSDFIRRNYKGEKRNAS